MTAFVRPGPVCFERDRELLAKSVLPTWNPSPGNPPSTDPHRPAPFMEPASSFGRPWSSLATEKFGPLQEPAWPQKTEQNQSTKTSPAEKNVQAFLRLLRYIETGKDDAGAYYVLYGGGTFKDDSTHPLKKPIHKGKYPSSSAGAYQINHDTWETELNKGVANDFTPASQDAMAIDLIRRKKALQDIEAGDLDKAIPKLRNTWSSLPGGSQERIKMPEAKSMFKGYVDAQK